MIVTAKCLIESLQVAAIETTQYTVSAGARAIIDKLTGTNTTASAATITVKLIPSGGVPAASNTIVSVKSIAPGECYTFPEIVGHVLNAGDSLSTLSGTGLAITLRASGREIT